MALLIQYLGSKLQRNKLTLCVSVSNAKAEVITSFITFTSFSLLTLYIFLIY